MLIGGFSPDLTGADDTQPEYSSNTPTVFSGEKNNGIADNGDAVAILNFSTISQQ